MVLPSCIIFGVVAGTISTDFQPHQAVFRVLQRCYSKQKAIHANSYPCQTLGSDLFTYNEVTDLLVVDYFLRYVEVIQLKSLISQSILLLWDSGNLRQCNVVSEIC